MPCKIDIDQELKNAKPWTIYSEGAKFWLRVFTELKNRGIQDIFIACVDGLKGLPEAINAVFPNAEIRSASFI